MSVIKLVVKACLLNEAGQILILTRSATDIVRPGELDLPGGSVDEGEGYHQAVLREIQEEIGVTLAFEDVALVYSETSYYEDRSTIRFLYAGRLPGGTEIKLSHEHKSHAWMTLAELPEKFSHPVWVKAIQYAAEHQLLPVPITK